MLVICVSCSIRVYIVLLSCSSVFIYLGSQSIATSTLTFSLSISLQLQPRSLLPLYYSITSPLILISYSVQSNPTQSLAPIYQTSRSCVCHTQSIIESLSLSLYLISSPYRVTSARFYYCASAKRLLTPQLILPSLFYSRQYQLKSLTSIVQLLSTQVARLQIGVCQLVALYLAKQIEYIVIPFSLNITFTQSSSTLYVYAISLQYLYIQIATLPPPQTLQYLPPLGQQMSFIYLFSYSSQIISILYLLLLHRASTTHLYLLFKFQYSAIIILIGLLSLLCLPQVPSQLQAISLYYYYFSS